MTTTTKSFRNLEELVAERKRLQVLTKAKGKEVSDSFHYLQENLGDVLFDSATAGMASKEDPVMQKIFSFTRLTDSFLPPEFLKNKTLKLVLRLTQLFAGTFVYRKVKKFFD